MTPVRPTRLSGLEPLVITPDEIDVLIARATKSLDEAYKIVKDEGLFVAG